MTTPDKKFFFDRNIFDAPPKEEVLEDLPPPPPVYSEDELGAAKDMAFEQGRQQGQKEQLAAREQFVGQTLSKIAESFSHLFAAETLRENVYEKESLRLSIAALDLLFPTMTEKAGRDEVRKVIEKTLSDHRKTKEISILVAPDMKGEIEALISRLRSTEHEEVLWRVTEDPTLSQGDCRLEWSDGGAVRDSVRAARDIRRNMENLLAEPVPHTAHIGDSEPPPSDVLSKENSESSPGNGETP